MRVRHVVVAGDLLQIELVVRQSNLAGLCEQSL
jgi:hypothetical protein